MSLSDIFSNANQSKFDRILKPVEIIPTPQIISKTDDNNNEVNDNNQTTSDKHQRKIETPEEMENKKKCTLFLGNLSTTVKSKDITKLCSEYGEVQSVRLRSLPVAGTAIDEAGNHDRMKKVCAIKRMFGDQKGSMNAYVVFAEPESVTKALALNNTLLSERHIRADFITPSILEPRRTVFIGSLQHYVDEEELRTHFAAAMPNGQEDIECVRIIRDNETMMGKGIAYISFASSECVIPALSLHQVRQLLCLITISINVYVCLPLLTLP